MVGFDPSLLPVPDGVPLKIFGMNPVQTNEPTGGQATITITNTYAPHMRLVCAGCCKYHKNLPALYSHMYGQGAGKTKKPANVKQACPNYITEFAYYLNLEVCDNKVSATDNPVTKEEAYPIGDVPSDVLDEACYKTYCARRIVENCNNHDPPRMCYAVRPPPDVPAEFIKQYVFVSPKMALLDVPLKYHWYICDWRHMCDKERPPQRSRQVAIQALIDRIDYEARVKRYAEDHHLDSPDNWIEVPEDFVDNLTKDDTIDHAPDVATGNTKKRRAEITVGETMIGTRSRRQQPGSKRQQPKGHSYV